MEQLQQAFERRERRRLRLLVAVVEARLDRLREPVAEVVEGEPVQLLRRVREVELAEQALDLALGGRQARENPALLELARLLVRDAVAGVRNVQPLDLPEVATQLAP